MRVGTAILGIITSVCTVATAYAAYPGEIGHVIKTGMDPVFRWPSPPIDLPYDFSNALTDAIVSLTIAIIVGVIAAISAKKRGRIYPVMVAFSGLLFAIVEVFIDIAGGCYWAVGENHVVFTIMGRSMTWLPIASWLGFGAILIYTPYSLLRRNVQTKTLWIAYVLMWVVDIIFEEISLRVPGLYTYYGNQPFVLSVFPTWWVFVNAAGCFLAAAVLYRFEEHLQGWKSIAVFFLAPLAYMASFGFVCLPATIVVNGNYSWFATQFGGLATAILAVLSVALTMSLVLGRSPLDKERQALSAA